MATKIEKLLKIDLKEFRSWANELGYSVFIGLLIGWLSIGMVIPNSRTEWGKALEILAITTVLAFVAQVLYQILSFFHYVEHNPIMRSLPEISKKIREIPDLTMKDGILDFAVDSFRKMANEGFVQLNVGVDDYIKYLLTLSANAKEKIYGTNVFRPKVVLEKITGSSPRIKEYLKIMRESKCKQKIRINILSTENIKMIIRDAVRSLEPDNQKGSVEYDISKIEFIPEIVWYLKEINGWQPNTTCQKIDNLWTTHDLALEKTTVNNLPKSKTCEKEIDDYAIFDDQILFLYDHNESVDKGTIVLQWDTESKENGMVQTYLYPFLSIAEQLPKEGKVYDEKNLFSNLSALVDKIKWDAKSVVSESLEARKDLYDLGDLDEAERNDFKNIVKNHFVDANNCPGSMYRKLKKLIRDDGFKFKDTYFNKYFNVKI